MNSGIILSIISVICNYFEDFSNYILILTDSIDDYKKNSISNSNPNPNFRLSQDSSQNSRIDSNNKGFFLNELQKFFSRLKRDEFDKVVDNSLILENEFYFLVHLNFSFFSGFIVFSKKLHGLFNGLQSLHQLIRVFNVLHGADQEQVKLNQFNKAFYIFDWPDLEIRGFHLDLKDMMPTTKYIKELIDQLAFVKINTIVIEYEDKFPYSGYLDEIPHKYAFTKESLKDFHKYCSERFIEIIPLIQIFGHVENFIRKQKYKHLQETVSGEPQNLTIYDSWALCPLHEETPKFVNSFIDQIINAHPDSRFVHIGADEVYQLGTCPKCKEYVNKYSKSKLYIQHINKAAERIIAAGKIPIIWHDYLLKYPENLNELNPQIIIMYWIYHTWRNKKSELKDTINNYYSKKILPYYDYFHEKGFRVIGAPSVSSDFDLFLPNLRSRIENVAGQTMRAKESGALGVLMTSWAVCANPIDTQYPAIWIGASFAWTVPNSWINLPWGDFENTIDITFLKMDTFHPKDNYTELQIRNLKGWLANLADAAENKFRYFPSIDSVQYIPISKEKLSVFNDLVKNNFFSKRVIQSLLYGVVFRDILSIPINILEKFGSIIEKYSESEKNSDEFPSMDYLYDILIKIDHFIKEYNSIFKEIIDFYTTKTNQLLPGEFDRNYKWDRYKVPEWIFSLKNNIKNTLDAMDELLLDVLRNKSTIL